MDESDREILLEAVCVLAAVTAHCPVETRHTFRPLIDAVDFMARASDRDEAWFPRLRVVARRWVLLAEFFESLCGVGPAEPFVEEARRVVRAQGLEPQCERLRRDIAGRAEGQMVGKPSRS